MEEWNSNDWQGRSRENVESNYSSFAFVIIWLIFISLFIAILNNY